MTLEICIYDGQKYIIQTIVVKTDMIFNGKPKVVLMVTRGNLKYVLIEKSPDLY